MKTVVTSVALFLILLVLITPVISSYHPVFIFIIGGSLGHISYVISCKLHEN